ncbi:uncharacterized protein LOC124788674 [Schistocerca piceifrons]|uniref:uncharacterized protein LOC124788674 n=1 Tax=Schistocerca piceifrons TaxID=274613 RepID=UPI001F5F08D6|nr:uncharacterized protein LOC124788674 [Schistocerca piceifrons]
MSNQRHSASGGRGAASADITSTRPAPLALATSAHSAASKGLPLRYTGSGVRHRGGGGTSCGRRPLAEVCSRRVDSPGLAAAIGRGAHFAIDGGRAPRRGSRNQYGRRRGRMEAGGGGGGGGRVANNATPRFLCSAGINHTGSRQIRSIHTCQPRVSRDVCTGTEQGSEGALHAAPLLGLNKSRCAHALLLRSASGLKILKRPLQIVSVTDALCIQLEAAPLHSLFASCQRTAYISAAAPGPDGMGCRHAKPSRTLPVRQPLPAGFTSFPHFALPLRYASSEPCSSA